MTLCIGALAQESGQDGGDRIIVSFDKRLETSWAGGDVELKIRFLTGDLWDSVSIMSTRRRDSARPRLALAPR